MITLYTTERDYPWGVLRSTNGSKVRVVLEEKKLAYRIENVSPGNLWKKPPEMLARHPLGKVPYLDDDGLTIFDSTVINEYLEERYPGLPLMPAGPVERARVREMEQFGDEAILVGDLPAIWMPYWSEPARRNLEQMEKGRAGLRKWALPFMALAMVFEVDNPDLSDFPAVGAYLHRLRERPSYQAISPRTKAAPAPGRG